MTFRVVVTDQVFPDVETEGELLAEAGGELVVARGSREEVLSQAADADALLNTFFGLSSADIAGLHKCRVIARYGIGVDNIDLDAARNAGIRVTNVPDYCVEEVGVHTVGLALALMRRIPQGDALVRAGGWGVKELGGIQRLSESTMGLLGYGRIAHHVATAMRALGARVIVHDPYVDPAHAEHPLVELEELFAESDLVSVHCPLTPRTRGLIDERALARFKPGSRLVNTSRGPIVVLDDLIAALQKGQLSGAALDVFDPEPPQAERVKEAPNLLMTPHSAFYSREAVRESQRKATTQVIKAMRGEPLDYSVV